MSNKIVNFDDFRGKRNSNRNPDENKELSLKYLSDAIHSGSIEEAIELTDKAIEADPENIDARLFKIEIDNDEIRKIELIDDILDELANNIFELDKKLNANSDTSDGDIVMNNYLKCLHYKLLKLIDIYRLSDAIDVGREMLELVDSDPYRVRYSLMSLYACFEDDYSAEELFSKYKDESIQMLLPLSVLYFRIGEYEHARTLILRVHELNSFIYEYLYNIEDFDEFIPDRSFKKGSRDEAVLVLQANEFLIDPCIPYVDFLIDCISDR